MKIIIDWLRIVLISLKREAICVLHSKILIFLLIILPFSIFPFFGFFYSQGILTDLPVGIYDEDKSELSRQLTRAIESSRSMKIKTHFFNNADLENDLRCRKIYAAFYFPAGMEKNLKKQHQAFPVFYKNSQNIVIANSLFKDASTIFKTYSAGAVLKKISVTGKTALQGKAIVQPVTTDILYLCNPNYNYSQFLTPAYIFVICQIILMMSGMFSIAHEIEGKRYVRMIESAYRFPAAILTGKYITIMSIFGLVLLTVQFVMFPLFHIHLYGPPLKVFMLIILYASASLVPGFAIGAILKNPFLATEVLIILNMPSLLVSGYTFPAVPKIITDIAQILPFMHFMPAYFKIAQLDAPLFIAYREITILVMYSAAGLFIAWLSVIFMSTRMRKHGAL